jgi:molybdopterin/thiamine biosynthesis adenylyltransferase
MTTKLCWMPETPNVLGALFASCFGVGAAFFAILGRPPTLCMETSVFSHEVALPGALEPGPPLPVGCGAVANGWAYAVKRFPIARRLQAIDNQSLRLENIWSYVAVGRESVGKPKAAVMKEVLAPAINVMAKSDQWEFFKTWLDHGLEVPPLIIAGLDNVTTRHSVQRLWPETLIDMAAGGLQSQVLVKHKNNDGLCLLNALSTPPDEKDWAENLAAATGLDPALIASNPTGAIT